MNMLLILYTALYGILSEKWYKNNKKLNVQRSYQNVAIWKHKTYLGYTRKQHETDGLLHILFFFSSRKSSIPNLKM